MLVIISGSSGSGKNSVIREIIKKYPNVQVMKSCTTRAPRDKTDVAYIFLTEKEFNKKLLNDEFFETEEVHQGIMYGVLKESLEKVKGAPIYMKDIDVNGARKIKKELKNDARMIYLDAPKEILMERIINRGETQESAEKRLSRYDYERSFIKDYDFVVENYCIEETVNKICKFLELKR